MYSFRLPALALLLILSAFTLVCASPAKRQFDSCGQSCFSRGRPGIDAGTCTATDFGCLCNFQPFIQSAINCISTQCSGSEQETLYTQLELRCLQAGISVVPSATTPGITASVTRTVIDIPTSAGTSTGTATLTSPSSSPPSSITSQSSSALRVQRYSVPGLLGALAAVALLV